MNIRDLKKAIKFLDKIIADSKIKRPKSEKDLKVLARGGFSEKPTTVFAPKFKSEKWDKLIESESTWSKAANEKYEKINSENDKIEFLNWIETVSKYCVHAKKSNCPIPNKIIELKSEVEKELFSFNADVLDYMEKMEKVLGTDAKKRYAQEA